jgi:hypothetical protein
MKRLCFVCLSATWIVTSVLSGSGLAQDPVEILDHYRLVPQLSTLRQTGGFAGVNLRYRLIGEYDLSHGLRPNSPAGFENAGIWGSLISDLPTPAVVLDVDEVLNFEGLVGKKLPSFGPLDLYQFRGQLGDESSVMLHAAVLGRWMYLRGVTQPPPGSADFFEYQINAVARAARPFADFDGNGVVDAADYVAARKSIGGVASAADDARAIGATLDDWRQQFGESIPDLTSMERAISAAAASAGLATAVPEPAGLALAVTASLLFALLRRNDRSTCRRHKFWFV